MIYYAEFGLLLRLGIPTTIIIYCSLLMSFSSIAIIQRGGVNSFTLFGTTRTRKSSTPTPASLHHHVPRGLPYDTILELARKRYNCTRSKNHGNENENNYNNDDDNDNDNYHQPMKGRVAVITGAAGGIGGELSTIIYRFGGIVIALDRNIDGLEKLQNKLVAYDNNDDSNSNSDCDNTSNTTSNNERRIWTIQTNHEDLSSVACTAELIKSRYYHIDLLINNAGMAYPRDINEQLKKENNNNDDEKKSRKRIVVESVHGKDLVFTVNYLSHFLLTEKLLPNLMLSSNDDDEIIGGRIVHITSTYHWKVDGSELMIHLPGDDDENENDDHYDGHKQCDGPIAYQSDPKKQSPKHFDRSYANTKLAQLWHSRSLGSRIQKEQQKSSSSSSLSDASNNYCSSVCACPTWAATNIAGDDGSEGKDFLNKYAFPISDCGPGITSSINAIFRTNNELGDVISHNGSSDNSNDSSGSSSTSATAAAFIANSRIVEYLYPTTILSSNLITNQLKWRDALTDFASVILLFFQKYTHEEFIIQRTSPESFQDKQQINKFYEWSLREVQQWL